MKQTIVNYDLRFIAFLRRYRFFIARGAIFMVYAWFGVLKLLDKSPASPIAEALVTKTVGHEHFHTLFIILALFECLIGILFLFPKVNRVVFPLLLAHLIIVCSPLVLVPEQSWSAAFVPTLEGQYILKNVLIVALAVTIAADTTPVARRKK
jgi:uncharacterized membrane protein YkgB